MTNFYNNTAGLIYLQNVTVDSSAVLAFIITGTLSMNNCILANVTNLGSSVSGNNNGFYNCQMVGTNPFTNTFYPFQTVGAGNYYLAGGCNFTNQGTTNIDSTLLADLGNKTTHPPLACLGTTISTATNWSLQAPRDTNVAPDLGYHYDPLDYLVSDVTVQAILTLTNGVAVGGYGGNGLTVTTNGSWISQGTAVNWNYLVPCSLVQEQPSANATPAALISNNGNWQGINMRFTDLAMPGGVGYLLSVTDDGTSGVQGGAVTFQDCQLHGGLMTFTLGSTSTGTSSGTFSMTNNLVDRCQVTLSKYDSIPSAIYVNQFNNLYHGGVLNIFSDISQDSTTLWRFYDNLFEGNTINEFGNDTGNPPYWSVITNGYNGYVNSTVWYDGGFCISPTLLNSVGGDQFPSVADYQTGPLGSYYYPTNGGNLSQLIHAGSRSAAAASLYHYTVTTDQVVEGTNTVSIGYHYVAVDTNGIPLDSNGDGIPDYLEDANGNGLDDSGETNWSIAILMQPANQVAVQGNVVIFNVTATGVTPLNYQWYFNSAALTGATNATLNLTNVQTGNAGTYNVVITNTPGSLTSSNAVLTVLVPPTVSITNPVNNSSFTVPTNITINATASGNSGTVTQVQFFVGTRLLGIDTNAPYSVIWSNAPVGMHVLTAIAMDNLGITGTSSVVNVSISTNLLPMADAHVRDGSSTNANFGTNIVMECLSTNGSGNNRDIYFKFDLTGVSNISSARLSVFAKLGGTGSVSNAVYSVTNTSWLETNITWNNKPARVTALTTNSVTGTNWYLFDVSSYVKSQKSNGQNVVSLALHDPTNYSLLISINSKENTTNKPSLVILTTNSPLSVSITTPANGTIVTVPTNLAINVSAADTDGNVTQVQFFVGTKLVGVSTNVPYGVVWSNAPPGAHVLSAIAMDDAGLSATSSMVNVTVINNLLPAADAHVRDGSYADSNFGVNPILEEENASATGNNRDAYLKFDLSNISTNISSATLNVFAGSSNGPSSSEFDLYPVADASWGELTITWNNKPALGIRLATTNVSRGSSQWYQFDVTSYVKSQQAAGQSTVSLAFHDQRNNENALVNINSRENSTNNPALIIYTTNTPLNISITSPADGTVVAAPTNLIISASAPDTDGTVTQIQFFAGTKLLGISTTTPGSVIWTNVASGTVIPGSYPLTAIARDASGLMATSSVVNVTITYVDSDGDGIPDIWEPGLGLNPSVNDTAQSGERSNYTYDPAGRLQQVYGARGETLSPDPQGNILQDSQ